MLGDETMKKLRTHKLMKQDLGLELYLADLHDESVRKCISSLESVLTGLELNAADILVKSKKIDYVTRVIPLKMKCTSYVSVKI